MSMTPAERAEIIAASTARHVHHEAGHAVAAVAHGGYLIEVRLGVTDWDSDDDDADVAGYTRHQTPEANQPFVTYAGPWASAKWDIEADHAVDDFDSAVENAWINAFEDAEKYEALAARLGPFDEFAFADELEVLWPVIRDVAAMLLAGETVTHAMVAAAIAAAGLDDDEAVA